MQENDIIKFIKNNIQPLDDGPYGKGYRASVTLKDGTFLPCVVFRNAFTITDLAILRFKETKEWRNIFKKSPQIDYRDIVKSFVTRGNCVDYGDIASVDFSRFAFPAEVLKQIKGETSMCWTAFVARFKDGRHLSFGTTWYNEFFDLPGDFKAEDIVEIINHSYLLKTGEIVDHRSSFDRITRREEIEKIYGDKPFFECYIDNL